MGQILPFPLAALAYPNRTEDLENAESLLLLSVRWWVAAVRHDEDPAERLELGLAGAGLAAAAAPLDALMQAIVRTARRRIQVNCPRCPAVSADEAQLLDAVSLAQSGEPELATRALTMVLLSTHGAEFALEPLAGIGALFTAAGRLLRRRHRRPSAAGVTATLLQ
jgi:hypothetical protein